MRVAEQDAQNKQNTHIQMHENVLHEQKTNIS